jgi:hypothetical protein
VELRLKKFGLAPNESSELTRLAFRNAAQRRFVASMIALRPAALSSASCGQVRWTKPLRFAYWTRPISSVERPQSWHEPQQTSGVSWARVR